MRPPERDPGMRGLPQEAPREVEALSTETVSAKVSQAGPLCLAGPRLPALCGGPWPGLLPPAVARRPRPKPDPRPSAEFLRAAVLPAFARPSDRGGSDAVRAERLRAAWRPV